MTFFYFDKNLINIDPKICENRTARTRLIIQKERKRKKGIERNLKNETEI